MRVLSVDPTLDMTPMFQNLHAAQQTLPPLHSSLRLSHLPALPLIARPYVLLTLPALDQ